MNVRVVAVMSGGILFGPWVGITTGVIAGIHRYLIDIHGITSIPCLITSIVAGFMCAWIHRRIPRDRHWSVGIAGGMLCESLTMLLVVLWARPFSLGLDIVAHIAIPMILGAVSIGLIVLLVRSVEGEKEAIAARQAKLALDIANKTLPLFRHSNSQSLSTVCDIIRRDIDADAVAITNTSQVLAYVGVGEENYHSGDCYLQHRRTPDSRLSVRQSGALAGAELYAAGNRAVGDGDGFPAVECHDVLPVHRCGGLLFRR